FVPTRATATVLADELPIAPGERAVIPASSLSDDDLPARLRLRGATVEQVIAYDNVPVPLSPEQLETMRTADAITFASASTARNLNATLGEARLPDSVKLVTIGPET